VATTLGASPLRVFMTITLPLAIRGIIAGGVLTFARALGNSVQPSSWRAIFLAGRQPLSTSIYGDIPRTRWRRIPSALPYRWFRPSAPSGSRVALFKRSLPTAGESVFRNVHLGWEICALELDATLARR
jgi:hypothetical protein